MSLSIHNTPSWINFGSSATLDTLFEAAALSTIAFWMKRPAVPTTSDRIFNKGDNNFTTGWMVRTSVSNANTPGFIRHRSTARSEATASSALLGTDEWVCLAVTCNDIVDGIPHMYFGTLTTPFSEVSYAVQTAGSGTRGSAAAYNLYAGRPSDTSSFNNWLGTLGPTLIAQRVMSLGELQAWQYSQMAGLDCIGLYRPGDNGTGNSTDLSGSGNTGVVTGCTLVANPPLPRWRMG